MIGTRVYPKADGFLDVVKINTPAHYGRATNRTVVGNRAGWWQITTPDDCQISLNPQVHTVTEHEDGTISVRPSIDNSKMYKGGWHGWLIRGVFKTCQ